MHINWGILGEAALWLFAFFVFALIIGNFLEKSTPSKVMLTTMVISVLLGYFLSPVGGIGLFLLTLAVVIEFKGYKSLLQS